MASFEVGGGENIPGIPGVCATRNFTYLHYCDIIMGTMASQITSLTIVYSTDLPVTGEFPAQRASYAENVSIWWRHHVVIGPWAEGRGGRIKALDGKTHKIWRTMMSMAYLCFLNPGGRFKNTYELLNLRALKISKLHKNHIFQCMGKIFCVEFQRVPLKFHTKYLTHTLKDVDFIHIWKFKSS